LHRSRFLISALEFEKAQFTPPLGPSILTDAKGAHSDEWVTKTMIFLDRAFSLSKINKVRCPCSKCQNMRCLDKTTVSMHLCRHGFMSHHELWRFHDESATQTIEEEEEDDYSTGVDRMDEMLIAIQPEFIEDHPTVEAESLFKILKALEEPLHEHTEVTLLAFMTRLMAIKSKYFFSNNYYNILIKLINDPIKYLKTCTSPRKYFLVSV
jgi:hypothetical protein